MPPTRFLLSLAACGVPLASWAALDPAAPIDPPLDAGQTEFFEKNIRPVLADKCYKCHSAESTKVKGGLLLDTRQGIRAGGDTGHAVVPGSVSESLLVKALHWEDKDLRMPPEKDGGKLPDEVIANFEKWIAMGAPDPRVSDTKAAKKGIDLVKARQAWAYQMPKAAPAPAVKDAAWPRTEVDRFVLAAQEAKGLHPVADADRLTLLRRVYFDLVGLPPTPAEIEAFTRDQSPEALAKVVDELLARPQFGERWGRHWLDTARFAESTGKERNFTFPEAWRYRDWVIDAVNDDKPYDRFIVEQLAGDLLPSRDSVEHDAHLVATGFLAVGPKGLNEKNKEIFRMEVVDDQIDTTSRAVLGLTVACARCHDHKFDPIPTKDYYALAGIFRSTSTYFGTGGVTAQNKNGTKLVALGPPPAPEAPAVPEAAPVVPAPAAPPAPVVTPEIAAQPEVPPAIANDPQKVRRFANLPPEKRAELMKRFGKGAAPAVSAPPAAPVAESVPEKPSEPAVPARIANDPAMAQRLANLPPGKRAEFMKRFGKDAAPAVSAPPAAPPAAPAAEATPEKPAEPALPPRLANDPAMAARFASLPPEQKERLLKKLGQNPGAKFGQGKRPGQAADTTPADGRAHAMAVGDGAVANAAILIRGEVDHRGDTVPRGVLSVLTTGTPPEMPAKASGRLELAEWLTSPENPLTARVMVNRVWQHLFGEGLVRTADNFGATGEAPSNPALLDALAVQFMQDGWSVKRLVRSLVLSHTYQLSGATNAQAQEIDPGNRLLWRATPRRLDAEAIRDAILAASGKIDLNPLHGSVVAKTGDGYIGKGIRPESFMNVTANYRSVYLPIVRDFVPEALDIFDFAEPSLVVPTRDVTNVPGQALYLLNNDFVRAQAAALAKRVLETPEEPQRIALAYQLTLSRPPTDAERARAQAFVADESLHPAKPGFKGDPDLLSWSTFCQALFASAEFRYLK
ncbi:MAG TPA: PSD1 and planctomycete cytochrome C domain-containing protein [Chthoniobacteraceae bacterium]|nr:PSD1 and planctomycete cytochrome C domain-containing protein [Chthoniobacteraceae bacterium]